MTFLWLSLAPGQWTRTTLPAPMADPFRTGPGDPLRLAIFSFAENGLVCKTVNGWSVHAPDGTLRGWASDEGINAIWWMRPGFAAGSFFVTARTGPSGMSYRIDLTRRVLVPASQEESPGCEEAARTQPRSPGEPQRRQ